MKTEATFYGINCDLCEDDFEDSREGYSFFADESYTNEKALEQGWFIGTIGDRKVERHYCPKCHHINDDDKLILTPQTTI